MEESACRVTGPNQSAAAMLAAVSLDEKPDFASLVAPMGGAYVTGCDTDRVTPPNTAAPPDAVQLPTVKRKAAKFPGRQPTQKVSRTGGHADGAAAGTTPPGSPPGEAFATNFLRAYVDRGALLTREVMGLASNPARKWGLACELPAGWYVIDDAPRPEQALARFDMAPARACGWKVTGPQMKSFNPTVPVQIRYGNPKGGCTPEYGVMRAAVYTWCHEEASGDVVEGNIKLIHIYIGRASRNRNMPRRQAGRRTARAEALAVHVCHASSSPLTPAPPRETRTRTARNGSPASPSVIIARSSIS